ncbi:MAG: sugar phosphate isomerase/epimerase [Chloroflexi bacterium]|nr:sugar phosphate isomerase/epimerase [Chloroflexota bacterium]
MSTPNHVRSLGFIELKLASAKPYRVLSAIGGHGVAVDLQALVGTTDELVRFVKEVDRPNFRANADISHLHLSDATFSDVAKMTGLIGHIHLSDCDGKVHGDLPAGLGVTPIREYLQAIVDTGYEGTISIELEYAPNPAEIVAWATTAYTNTAAIMRDLGVRD